MEKNVSVSSENFYHVKFVPESGIRKFMILFNFVLEGNVIVYKDLSQHYVFF